MKWVVLVALALPLADWPWADRLVRGTNQAAPANAIVVLADECFTTNRLEAGLTGFKDGLTPQLIVSGVVLDYGLLKAPHSFRTHLNA